ncbi:MAG: dihydropyrimidinase [Pseudomonadota bacterium]
MTEPDELLISGGRVYADGALRTADVRVRDGVIVEIAPGLTGAPRVLSADGLLVLPGGIDPHVHIEQMSGMGLWNADTFETASCAAALGGTTALIAFAAQQPGQRLAEAVSDYAVRANAGCYVDYAFHLSVSDVGVPDFATDLMDLVAAGHRSIKVFTTYNIGLSDHALIDVLSLARRSKALVCVHAENDGIVGWMRESLVASGKMEPFWHAVSRPRLAEVEAVFRLCTMAELLAQPVMIFHVSCARALAVIAEARSRGVPVWAETCPHYLLSTADVLAAPGLDGAKWMCSPPQRDAADVDALWGGIADGTIDLVSSDHAPYRFDTTGKLAAGSAPPFTEIANGLPGIELRQPLLFDAMVSQGRGGLEQFVRTTSERPAEIYGLRSKGRIAPGYDADIVLWDPDTQVTYCDDDLHDNVGYNPWSGRTIRGYPRSVLVRGQTVVSDGKLTDATPSGRWIARPDMGVRALHPPAPEIQAMEANP